jgi:CheY-like chemotaxis protein
LQGIGYRFDSLEELSQELTSCDEDCDLPLPCAEGVRDGEWLLVTFTAGDDISSVPARVCDRGGELRLTFEERDWERLVQFAESGGRSTLPPASHSAFPEALCAPPGTTALLVDVDTAVLSIVGTMLGACGVTTSTAQGAEEALDLIRRGRFDLVVVEPVLDGMSGLELCRRVRNEFAFAPVPILVLTSHSTAADAREALAAGANDFVGKPFRAHELRARALRLIQEASATPSSAHRL